MVGVASDSLLACHRHAQVKSSAYLTAWNPFSVASSPKENAVRQQMLVADLKHLGVPMTGGVGVDPSGQWPGEDSLLAMGLSEDEAIILGWLYGQNAVVWAGEDAVPTLVLLR
jgi:hypothetical protein